MRVSFEQLEAFVLTHVEGSFSAAARKCDKAQSVISTLVSNLEVDLGIMLFDRSARYPELTEAGTVLVTQAKTMIEQRKRFLAVAESISLSIESRIVVAIAQHVKLANLGMLLEEFNLQFPTTDIEIQSGSISEIQKSVLDGSVDLGIIVEPETSSPGIDFKSLGHLKLVCVCGPEYPLAKLERVSLDELKLKRQILLEEGGDPQVAIFKASPEIWQVNRISEAIDLLKAGLGWAGLPYYSVVDLAGAGELNILNLEFEAGEFVERGVDLIWSASHPTGPAASFLKDLLSKKAQLQNG